MAAADYLFQILEWTKQILDKNEEIVVDIEVGDFKFAFNNKKTNIVKHKSPSQIKRNIERQKEYQKRFENPEHKIVESETLVDEVVVKQETFEKEIKDKEAGASHQDEETQTLYTSEDVGTQTDDDKFHLVRNELQIDEHGNISVEESETIIELKFSHGMDNWSQINQHIRETLKMKMKSRAWLANSGPHFKIIAFVMDKAEYEKWKFETLNWENISKSSKISRIYK